MQNLRKIQDLKFISDVKVTVGELRKFGEQDNVVYNVMTKYDTENGICNSIITVSNLDVAMEVMKKNFEIESLKWMKESKMDDEDIAKHKELGYIYIDDTDAVLELGDEYLSMYITANKIIDSI